MGQAEGCSLTLARFPPCSGSSWVPLAILCLIGCLALREGLGPSVTDPPHFLFSPRCVGNSLADSVTRCRLKGVACPIHRWSFSEFRGARKFGYLCCISSRLGFSWSYPRGQDSFHNPGDNVSNFRSAVYSTWWEATTPGVTQKATHPGLSPSQDKIVSVFCGELETLSKMDLSCFILKCASSYKRFLFLNHKSIC